MGSLQPAGAMSATTTAFLVQATFWIVGLFALLRLRWVADHVLGGLIDFQMTVLSWQGTALGARLVVAPSCGGADVSARCLGVTLAYPVAWPHGYFDDEAIRLEPIEKPFAPEVLPMSPE